MDNHSGMMTEFNAEELISIWDSILAIQTDLFGAEEVKLLKSWGFEKRGGWWCFRYWLW